MFVDFLNFYNYTADQALNELAKRFFSLCAGMYKVKARENLTQLTNLSNGMNGGKEAKKLADVYMTEYEGNDRILREVRNVKK
jgi:hypothetical protein